MTFSAVKTIIQWYGLVAQLGAHHIRIVGVEGSNPFKSTKKRVTPSGVARFLVERWIRKGGAACGSAKKCPGDTFLARGRIHGILTAVRRTVGYISYSLDIQLAFAVLQPFPNKNAMVLLPWRFFF